MAATGQGRASARVNVAGRGDTNIATGVPVLDHLLSALAVHASFDLALEVAPGAPEAEITIAARSLGEALAEPLRAEGARGHGSAVVPADEALAHVALEASGRPLLVSNVDLSQARIAGLAGDLAARFLEEFAQAAGLTLHVRLVEGRTRSTCSRRSSRRSASPLRRHVDLGGGKANERSRTHRSSRRHRFRALRTRRRSRRTDSCSSQARSGSSPTIPNRSVMASARRPNRRS